MGRTAPPIEVKAEPGDAASPTPPSRARSLAAWADRHPLRASFALAAPVAVLTTLLVYLIVLGALQDLDSVWFRRAVVAVWLGGGLVAGFVLGRRALPSYVLAHVVATTPGVALFTMGLVGGDGGGPGWGVWFDPLFMIQVMGTVTVVACPVVAATLLGGLGRRLVERWRRQR